MLGKLSNNGLLVLFEAAKVLEEPRRNQINNINNSSNNRLNTTSKKNVKFPPRSSHNELEKSRRAHLRTCMESLKKNLNFDTDATRITMLSILKKASKTIQELKDENKSLQEAETKQKARWNQLMKKKSHLKKRIENRRYNKKIQNWRERNRNYSECSVATTSSEDTELDYQTRGINRSRFVVQSGQISNDSLSPISCSKFSDDSLHRSKSGNNSSAGTTPPTQSTGNFDTFDGCSLDSGYEENSMPNSQIEPNLMHLTPSINGNRSITNYGNVNNKNSIILQSKVKIDVKKSNQNTTTNSSAGIKRISSSNYISINPIKRINSTFIRTDIPIENYSI